MSGLLIICGPTACGKTKLALSLAKKFQGEIISADSRQVYKGMDIGTGKDLPVNSKYQIPNIKYNKQKLPFYDFENIRIWGVDLVDPDQEFSVAHFVNFANKAISGIWQRKKLPIIVGGTGFWIKALIQGVQTINIPPNFELRNQLNLKSLEELTNLLKKIDKKRWLAMNNSDRNNPRRLIRAIEVKKSNSNFQTPISKLQINKLLMIGLKAKDYQLLYKRIDKRVDKRIKQGAEKEIKLLRDKRYSWELPSFSATGYRIWQDFFESKKNLKELIQRWKFDEHSLARRQMTYFNKLKEVNWFDISQKLLYKKIEKAVRQWYS